MTWHVSSLRSSDALDKLSMLAVAGADLRTDAQLQDIVAKITASVLTGQHNIVPVLFVPMGQRDIAVNELVELACLMTHTTCPRQPV